MVTGDHNDPWRRRLVSLLKGAAKSLLMLDTKEPREHALEVIGMRPVRQKLAVLQRVDALFVG